MIAAGWFYCSPSLIAACAPTAYHAGLPYTLMNHDDGSVSGVWNGARLVLTIDLSIGTFVAQSGCTVSGGTLTALGEGRYRIGRYETGYSTDGCGPWKTGPAIAPFDGSEVAITRKADRLHVSGTAGAFDLKRRRLR